MPILESESIGNFFGIGIGKIWLILTNSSNIPSLPIFFLSDRFTFVFFTRYTFIHVLKVLKQQCYYNDIVKTKPIIKQFIGNLKMLYNTLIIAIMIKYSTFMKVLKLVSYAV